MIKTERTCEYCDGTGTLPGAGKRGVSLCLACNGHGVYVVHDFQGVPHKTKYPIPEEERCLLEN
jgi:DnaJ-class molecular chaperone